VDIALGRTGRTIPLPWLVAGLVLPLKLALSVVLPMTQDEAYFVMWGANPALGYSEHPPMIGWMEYLLLFIGRHPLIVRLPATLGTLSIGLGLFWSLQGIDRDKAALTATLFLLSPLNIVYVIVTPDTALIIFSFWSAALLFKATRSGRYHHYAAAGVFLGMAFLSKYFSALLAVAYVASYLLSAKDRKRTLGYVLLFACVIPFGLISLYWNYTHSWMEVRYPFYRDDSAQWGLDRPLTFLAMNLYLLLPAGLFYLAKHAQSLWGKVARSPIRLWGLLYLVPITVLAVLALRKSIGLHWLLSFHPLVYPVAGWVLGELELRKSIRIAAGFSVIHVLVLLGLLAVPLSWVADHDDYATFVGGLRPREIVAAVQPYAETHRLAAAGYGVAALLEYHYPGKHFAAWGVGSHHGRNDDFVTDFKEWDGEDVVIFHDRPPIMEEFLPYFDSVEVKNVEIEGAVFPIVIGTRFSYEAYRDGALATIRDLYFDVPEWLPMDSCYFRAKYFSSD
jgi:hypothetical protein